MSLLGKAAVAMWWSIAPDQRTEFGHWHSHEHFPERMSIPGFRRGSRWASMTDSEGFFVLYELEQHEVLASKAYLDRLNAPTPWSTKMMPHHLGMIRSQCRITASFGGGVATSLATIRLSPENGGSAQLQASLTQALAALAAQPGLTGAHLLVTDTPRTSAPTTEQRIRGKDVEADWIVILSGYDGDAVARAVADQLSPATLEHAGARNDATIGHYRLDYTMTPLDVTAG